MLFIKKIIQQKEDKKVEEKIEQPKPDLLLEEKQQEQKEEPKPQFTNRLQALIAGIII